VLEFILKLTGWTLARLPEPLVRCLACGLGDIVFYAFRSRTVLSNLHHAFPERTAAWRAAVGRESCRRLIETVLLSAALPFLPEKRLRTSFKASPALAAAMAAHCDAAATGKPYPIIFGTAHLCGWEAETVLSLLISTPLPEFGVIFRPLDNAAADAWVRRSRERFGMHLLSRKEGFREAMGIARRNGCIGILFDQNAGLQGALTTFFGRVASTSELLGLIAEKFHGTAMVMYPRRAGFWRVEVDVAPLASDGSAGAITIALNRWIEDNLASDDNLCASWLWAHDRWRHQDVPERRLRLESKRNLLVDDLRTRGLQALPRRTRLWIRVPNWLGDVVIAIPLLRAIRASRPDAEITLVARGRFEPILGLSGAADRIVSLPSGGCGSFLEMWRRRREYPDCYLLFPTSQRCDLEAWLTRCPQRFGVLRQGRRRPLLTCRWSVPPSFDERSRHQVEFWEEYLRAFGLASAPDFSPLPAPPAEPAKDTLEIGLICGSENSPEKRWPVSHWRELITRLSASRPGIFFSLLGTANDRPITGAVAAGFGPSVADLAGTTDMAGFAARLARCRLLVSNDTGGMHLANALGVPVVALFGPTNPVRTRPVFTSPVTILQPAGCPATGGMPLDALDPGTVAGAVETLLA